MMELAFGKFILLYLLMPIISVILGGVMFFIAKKNKLLSNKKAIFYFLLSCLILAIPALLGFIDYWFMPYAYVCLLFLYLILGYVNLIILKKVFSELTEKPYYVEFLCVFVVMFVGIALFSLAFNLCNELQYGLWASTCLLPFIFPSLFRKTHKAYMDIPVEVYKIWSYDKEERGLVEERYDSNKIIVVELELFKQVSDKEPLNIKAKASEDMPFSVWFKVFLEDYNKKSPEGAIVYADFIDSYGWIFYINTAILGRKKYIDPDLSFAQNKIKEENIIIAKRVKREGQSEVDVDLDGEV